MLNTLARPYAIRHKNNILGPASGFFGTVVSEVTQGSVLGPLLFLNK